MLDWFAASIKLLLIILFIWDSLLNFWLQLSHRWLLLLIQSNRQLIYFRWSILILLLLLPTVSIIVYKLVDLVRCSRYGISINCVIYVCNILWLLTMLLLLDLRIWHSILLRLRRLELLLIILALIRLLIPLLLELLVLLVVLVKLLSHDFCWSWCWLLRWPIITRRSREVILLRTLTLAHWVILHFHARIYRLYGALIWAIGLLDWIYCVYNTISYRKSTLYRTDICCWITLR